MAQNASACRRRTIAAGSLRSIASTYRSSRARSSSLGSSPTCHSRRRSGRCRFSVARARCRALFAAATLVSRSAALSAADQPRTSRTISAARCFGGGSWIAAMNAARSSPLATTSASGSASPEGFPPGPRRGTAKPRNLGGGVVPSCGRTCVDAARSRGTRWSRSGTAMRGTTSVPGSSSTSATPAGTSPGRVLGVLVGAEHAVAVRLELAPVGLGKAREGRLVAGARGGQCRTRLDSRERCARHAASAISTDSASMYSAAAAGPSSAAPSAAAANANSAPTRKATW